MQDTIMCLCSVVDSDLLPMAGWSVLLVVLLFVVSASCDREYYSSVGLLRDQLTMIKRDTVIRPVLKQLIIKQEERLNNIKSLAAILGELSGDEIRDPNFTIHHPLNAFRFIRNHSVIFNTTTTEMLQEIKLYEQGRMKIEDLSKQMTTLSLDDLKGTIQGILLIQKTYDLITTDMAAGNIGGVISEPLTAAECQDIMIEAYRTNYEDVAYSWLIEAVEKIEAGDNTTNIYLILNKAASTAAITGDYESAVTLFSGVVHLYPNDRYIQYRLRSYIDKMQEKRMEAKRDIGMQIKTGKGTKDVDTIPKMARYDAKCQEQITGLVGTLSKDMFCSYDNNNNNPLLLLQPAKLELLSEDPYIVIYHDVISERAMANLRILSKPRLRRSLVKLERAYMLDPLRISQVYTLPYDLKDVKTLFNRIEAMTSLKKVSYERVQIENFGIGGHHYNHHDLLPDNGTDVTEDNRMATFILYMSDVQAGGATVFPDISKVVIPKKGSAVFWYNIHPDNKLNTKARHAACPVVVGDKWVANVWIHRNNNEFTKPCHADKSSWR